jgi:ABC-2 type transport system ATP-binding protein
VRVRSPQAADLADALRREGGDVAPGDDGAFEVSGLDAARVGELAAAGGVVLHELTPVSSTLEEAYLELTADSVEYQTESPGGPPTSDGAPR